ncbi:hypothetical protein KQX54_009857 [Cotesia glomerata]|uniref:Uncharacterized protein n=1 Tax=Cotesia glomerata TaxID=32391 RepID=A0AAV7J2F0_COTGL|nr:hypothetical protein KQX54_009857 [Cotesia glomerata]
MEKLGCRNIPRGFDQHRGEQEMILSMSRIRRVYSLWGKRQEDRESADSRGYAIHMRAVKKDSSCPGREYRPHPRTSWTVTNVLVLVLRNALLLIRIICLLTER